VVLIFVLYGSATMSLEPKLVGQYLGFGVLVGGVAQLALVYWAARREGISLRLMRPKRDVKIASFLKLAIPTALSGGIVQVNLLVGQAIASAQAGAISLLQYADRLYQLPLGVIGIAIGVVLLPELTRAWAAEKREQAAKLMDQSLEFSSFLVLPSAVGLYVLADPITALLFERGAFTRETTLMTADAVEWFAIGLPAFLLIKVFTPAFFARLDTKTPMWLAALNAALNVIGSLVLFKTYGHVGIAMATAGSAWVNAIGLGAVLAIRKIYLPQKATLMRLLGTVAASIGMGALAYLANQQIGTTLLDAGLLTRIFANLGLIGGLGLVYLVLAVAFRAINLSQLRGFLSKAN